MLGERRGQLLWIGDEVYAVSLYIDEHYVISSALALLSLTQPGPPAERDALALSMQRREGCHPRYSCADDMEYIAGYVLSPYTVG